MPIKLGDIRKETKDVTFDYDGETVTVTYRHNAITPSERIRLAAGDAYIRSKQAPADDAETDPDPEATWWSNALASTDGYLRQVMELVTKWDILGDDGKPLPVTLEWMQLMPATLINAMVKAILEDGIPNPRNGKISPDILPPTV